jgi:tRNA pseudouridine38-40 synthase
MPMTADEERPTEAPAPGERRIAALVEYDGTAYAGWQFQQHAPNLQRTVEEALGFVAGHALPAVCAGRTDAGVHALGQVIHFDTRASRTARAWVLGTNTRLPADVALRWAREVPAGFHARHSALRRTYRYLILNRSARSALARQRVAWIHRPLDVERTQEAVAVLIGEHDFSAFRSVECQSKSTRRRVDRLTLSREGDLVRIDISANAFLHHMVRNIVGTLIDLQERADMRGALTDILASRDRSRAGPTAPACGLYLWRVDYPPEYAIPVAEASGAAAAFWQAHLID